MTAEYLTLRLTDGEETIDLVDNESFSLVEGGWSPTIAKRRVSQLNGYGPYTPVAESISLMVYGETASQAIQNLQRLVLLMDQADAWALGDSVDAVLLQVQVQGSTLDDPLETVIMGRVSDEAPLVATPPTFNDTLFAFQIGPITLNFIRHGLWFGAEAEGSAAAAQVTPAIFTVDLSDPEEVLSPTRIAFTGFTASTEMMGSALVALTGVSRQSTYGVNLGVYAAADMTSDEFAPVDDTANLAYGDDVMRIDAATDQTGTLTVSQVYADVGRLSVFAAVRNNNAATIWRVRAKSSGFVTTLDRWQELDETTEPQIVFVGTLSNQVGAHVTVSVEVETDGSSGTLDVNYIVVFPHDASSQHIAILASDYTSAAYERSLVVDHRATTNLSPNIWIETSA